MRAQLRALLLWICAATLLLISATPPASGQQQNCGLRIRRAWSSLSGADQTLYKNALAASMDSGAYIKFIEMHTEMMSTTEAHKSCMFIYWHRLFLVVFENMLRGQGPQFACITVPYWDWISDYNRFVSRECGSMLSCSRALQALGGVTGSTKVYLRINGVQTSGNCSTSYPLDHFCHAGNATGSQCVRCVTRGPWDTKYLPASASYASVRSQLFAANNINDMSTAVETGVHNSIHAALDGAMATFASPADPIFWSHHAMVDLLHTIFHKCRVGEQMMTLEQKVASPIGWNSRKRQNDTAFSPYDYVVMRTGTFGRNPINGSLDPLIGKYFGDVPRQFAALMDHNDLGSSSYLYLYQGLLGEMYSKCGNSTLNAATALGTTPAPTALAPAVAIVAPPAPTPAPTTKSPVSSPVPTPAAVLPNPTPTTRAPVISPPPAPTPSPTPAPTSRPPVLSPIPTPAAAPSPAAPSATFLVPAPTTRPPIVAPTPTPSPSSTPTTSAPFVWPSSTPVPTTRAPTPAPTTAAPIKPPSSAITVFQQRKLHRRLDDTETSPANRNQNIVIVAAVNTTMDTSARIVSFFVSNTDKHLEARLCADVDQVDEQEKMACMFQDECLGGVKDCSESFRRTSRCTASLAARRSSIGSARDTTASRSRTGKRP